MKSIPLICPTTRKLVFTGFGETADDLEKNWNTLAEVQSLIAANVTNSSYDMPSLTTLCRHPRSAGRQAMTVPKSRASARPLIFQNSRTISPDCVQTTHGTNQRSGQHMKLSPEFEVIERDANLLEILAAARGARPALLDGFHWLVVSIVANEPEFLGDVSATVTLSGPVSR